MTLKNKMKKFFTKTPSKNVIFTALALVFFLGGFFFVWAATVKIPDINSLESWKMTESTKIFDRTGKVLLYDVHSNIKRTVVPLDKISSHAIRASIAIEDSRFYEHKGIDFRAILRMIWINITAGGFSQGGSTITQQVAKNAFLSPEKTVTRKLKEWIIAIKMEKALSKEKILELYFNEVPYGGSVYGIEEASRGFFGKHANELTLGESAYLAAIPQAPTFYSPYGNNKDRLDTRQKIVLQKMLETKVITQEEYNEGINEKVVFLAQNPDKSITAPHFVIMVKQYLEDKYGADMVENGGLNVVTTLDADLQVATEDAVKKYGESNVAEYNAHNAAAVAIDPKTGHVLAMAGSRDYFNKEIDGNFNVALSPNRQPGSSFKPFVYATAFEKGYTPDTVLFDVPTEFNSSCTPDGVPATPGTKPEECYMPVNYDNKFRGPMSLRDALAQSVNVPAVKLSYLAGVPDSINTAEKMGITTLGKASKYGLTLVLGSGQVSLYEMTGAYSVFANNGDKNPNTFILSVTNNTGNVLEEYKEETEAQVIPKNTALQISDVLSDNVARAPLYDTNSPLYFPGRQVAVKTGTTNDYRDAWIIGYTPSFVLGIWAGNNDNSPMEKKISGFIVAPMWNQIMNYALNKLPNETFEKPEPISPDLKPILRGDWRSGGVHSILYWVDKNDPLGGAPYSPGNDPQFWLWETPVRKWAGLNYTSGYTPPSYAVKSEEVATNPPPSVSINSPSSGSSFTSNQKVEVSVNASGKFPITRADFYVNGSLIGTSPLSPFTFSFKPSNVGSIKGNNTLRVVVTDYMNSKGETSTQFQVE